MKKILSFTIILAVSLVTLVGCSKKPKKPAVRQPSPKELFLSECKKQLNLYVKDNFRNPDAAKLSDIKVVDSSDSLCILNFRFIAENGYGGHVNGKGQFILLRYDNENYISFMSNKNDFPHCVGSDWLGTLSEFSATTLAMAYCEKDSLVKAKCIKGDCFSIHDNYTPAYCIVKEYGEKVNPDNY